MEPPFKSSWTVVGTVQDWSPLEEPEDVYPQAKVLGCSPGNGPRREHRDLDLDGDRASVDPGEHIWSDLAERAFKLDVGRVPGAAKRIENLPFTSAVVLRFSGTERTAAGRFVGKVGGV
jgi:hypothetical protein